MDNLMINDFGLCSFYDENENCDNVIFYVLPRLNIFSLRVDDDCFLKNFTNLQLHDDFCKQTPIF